METASSRICGFLQIKSLCMSGTEIAEFEILVELAKRYHYKG
jgi:hypothetical protein